jgi:hypothetical protein
MALIVDVRLLGVKVKIFTMKGTHSGILSVWRIKRAEKPRKGSLKRGWFATSLTDYPDSERELCLLSCADILKRR